MLLVHGYGGVSSLAYTHPYYHLPILVHHLSTGGKSAILTGIVVALGGKARSTERGSSLKQFIKTGEKTAEVTVTLRNRGSEAYRPEEYGESITVVRQIKDDGTGSYKIKGHKGEVCMRERGRERERERERIT